MQLAEQKSARRTKTPPLTPEQNALLEEYYETIAKLKYTRRQFEHITDHDLITACVYELNAIQTRYSYLLTRIKQENITSLRVLR